MSEGKSSSSASCVSQSVQPNEMWCEILPLPMVFIRGQSGPSEVFIFILGQSVQQYYLLSRHVSAARVIPVQCCGGCRDVARLAALESAASGHKLCPRPGQLLRSSPAFCEA